MVRVCWVRCLGIGGDNIALRIMCGSLRVFQQRHLLHFKLLAHVPKDGTSDLGQGSEDRLVHRRKDIGCNIADDAPVWTAFTKSLNEIVSNLERKLDSVPDTTRNSIDFIQDNAPRPEKPVHTHGSVGILLQVPSLTETTYDWMTSSL